MRVAAAANGGVAQIGHRQQRGDKTEVITATVVEIVEHGLLTGASLHMCKERASSKALTASRGGAFCLEAADKTVVNFFDCVKQVKDFAQTHSKMQSLSPPAEGLLPRLRRAMRVHSARELQPSL
jgi:hypothetical protein